MGPVTGTLSPDARPDFPNKIVRHDKIVKFTPHLAYTTGRLPRIDYHSSEFSQDRHLLGLRGRIVPVSCHHERPLRTIKKLPQLVEQLLTLSSSDPFSVRK
eukprot:5526894-Pyramimonas_sp.AAC.1